ncbi:MAG: fibronectin type III domain-containing protein [Bacteroidia bacterium]
MKFLRGTQDALFVKAKHIGESLLANVLDYPGLLPVPGDGLKTITDYGKSLSDLDGSHAKRQVKDESKLSVQNLLRKWAGQVEGIAQGNKTLFDKSGFDAHQGKTASQEVGIPAGPKVKDVNITGAVKLSTPKKKGVVSNQFRHTQSDPSTATDWVVTDPCTVSMKVENLIPGKMYFFEVRATGAINTSGWSDATMFRVR